MFKPWVAEFIGTFVIVFAPVALASSSNLVEGSSGLLLAGLVSGLPVLAMIYALGSISGAHFNPAVTLGFAVGKRFPWRMVLPYWISQMLGGLAGAVMAYLLFGISGGAHISADTSAVGRNVTVEAVLTFILMLVIISVATDSRVSKSVSGLAIGFTVLFCVLIGGPVTGGSMNPARSLGPALFARGALSSYWLYVVGPFLGATAAALVLESIRLDKPDLERSAP